MLGLELLVEVPEAGGSVVMGIAGGHVGGARGGRERLGATVVCDEFAGGGERGVVEAEVHGNGGAASIGLGGVALARQRAG